MAKTATNLSQVFLSSDVPPSRGIYTNIKMDRPTSLLILIFLHFVAGNACNR